MLALRLSNSEVSATNHHLEQMAQALYRSWFVDFEPFDGSMPDHWNESKLGDLLSISTKAQNPQSDPGTLFEHYSIPAFDEARLPAFEYGSEIKSNKYLVDADCFMISKLNPATKRIWRPFCLTDNAVCSTEFIVYRPNTAADRDFLYSVVDSSEFSEFLRSHVTGSTGSRQRAIPGDTLSFPLAVPPNDVVEQFSGLVSPMYKQIAQNQLENKVLQDIRDSLLPRLISGELSVGDLEAK